MQWFGFDAIQLLEEAAPEIWLTSLPAHTRGHCGVAVQTADGWLLDRVDAYISRSDINPEQTPRSRSSWMQPVARRLFPHAPRLRALLREHGGKVQLFCAHNPFELARYQVNT